MARDVRAEFLHASLQRQLGVVSVRTVSRSLFQKVLHCFSHDGKFPHRLAEKWSYREHESVQIQTLVVRRKVHVPLNVPQIPTLARTLKLFNASVSKVGYEKVHSRYRRCERAYETIVQFVQNIASVQISMHESVLALHGDEKRGDLSQRSCCNLGFSYRIFRVVEQLVEVAVHSLHGKTASSGHHMKDACIAGALPGTSVPRSSVMRDAR